MKREGQHIDDYRLTRLLGEGTFGEVYLGEHLRDRSLAAVKLLTLSQVDLKAFIKEASATFRLKHPHIVHLRAFGISADESPYLVMDYAPNGTLLQRHPMGTRLPLDTIVSYLLPLAAALQYAHDSRVIHRDVKPANVLIGPGGEVLLSDFGVAVVTPIEQSLSTQNVSGTPAYMAPEQINKHPRPASDQYALGIMVYEWLCGVRPFQGTTWEIIDQHRFSPPPPIHEKLPGIPARIEEIILKTLTKEPQQRFARVWDFALALQQASSAARISPLPSSPPLPPQTSLPSRDAAEHSASGWQGSALPHPSPPVSHAPTQPPSRQSFADQQPASSPAAHPPSAWIPQTPPGGVPGPGGMSQIPVSVPSTPARISPRHWPQTALIVVLTLLLIAVSFVFFLLRSPFGPPAPPLGTTSPQTLTTTAPGGQTSVPLLGKIIFQDPLNKNNPSVVWKHPEDGSTPCGRFDSAGYHIISTGSLKGCQESPYQLQDVTVSVDISIAQGDSGGVYCRFATDFFHNYYGYLFEVNSSGQYKISLDAGGNTLQPWTDSPFIKKGLNVKNTLVMTVKYNTLSLYINGNFITTVIHKPPDYQATATADGATATAAYSNGPPNSATATAISTTLTYDQGKIPSANATPPLLKPEQGIALVASASTTQETEVVFSNLLIAVP